MGLLETNNKKFRLPFVFIAGVIFLVELAYFANYLENMSKDALNLETSNALEGLKNEKSVSILITKNLNVYIDSVQVDTTDIEEILKIKFDGHANPTIQLQAEEGVPIGNVVRIMKIARNNQYKAILKSQIQ